MGGVACTTATAREDLARGAPGHRRGRADPPRRPRCASRWGAAVIAAARQRARRAFERLSLTEAQAVAGASAAEGRPAPARGGAGPCWPSAAAISARPWPPPPPDSAAVLELTLEERLL